MLIKCLRNFVEDVCARYEKGGIRSVFELVIKRKRNNPKYLLKKFIQKNQFLKLSRGVIHVGASTGQERDFYAHLGLSVVWVEPIPEIFYKLQKNIESYPNQLAIQALLTDQAGQRVSFNVASNGGQSSSIYEFGSHQELWPEVTMVDKREMVTDTLANLIASYNLDLNLYDTLILDTQGSELLVIKGAGEEIKKFKTIKSEAANFEVYKGCCTISDISNYLADHGYIESHRWQFKSKEGVGDCYDVLYQKSRE